MKNLLCFPVIRKSLLLSGIFFLFFLSPAHAVVYTVTSTGDAGAGTLRDAIASANASAGVRDSIVFTLGGCANYNINLTSGALTLTDNAGVYINGFSQTCAVANSNTIQSSSG